MTFRVLIITVLFIICSRSYAEINVRQLEITCQDQGDICNLYKSRMESLRTTYKAEEQLVEALKSFSHLEGIRDFSFKLYITDLKDHFLKVNFGLRRLLSDISFKGEGDLEINSSDLSFSEGDFIDEDMLNSSKFVLLKKLADRGYPQAQVNIKLKIQKDGSYNLVYSINKNTPLKLSTIKIETNNNRNLFKIESSLSPFLNKPFNRTAFSIKLEEIKNDLIDNGYLVVDYRFSEKISGNKVHLVTNFDADTLYAFEFSKNSVKTIHELKKEANAFFLQNKGMPTDQNWQNYFREIFKSYGYLSAQVEYSVETFSNKNFETVVLSRFEIKLGEKYKLLQPVFVGNTQVKNQKIQELFYDTSSELINSDQFDEPYVRDFSKKLIRYYYSKGFVNAQIASPVINIDHKKNEVFVSYRVNEGDIATVDIINVRGLDGALEKEILATMKLKAKAPFDPFAFSSDLLAIVENLKSRGYYFARVSNLKDKNIVKYLNDQTTVQINIDIDRGDLVLFDRYYIIGNNKTRGIIFKRQMKLVNNEIITPQKIVAIQNRLLSTGLFESVRIDPIKTSELLDSYDLAVKVKEKKYGTIELAPGFRTDLGLKISTTITRSNLEGLNKSITLNAQVNRRVDGQSIDPDRRTGENPLEYDLRLSYLENDLFKSTYIDSETGLSIIKRRYYSFDANIERASQRFSKLFGDHYTVSFGYQLERIRQYEAIQEFDNGVFRIGTITPSFQIDYRDTVINPKEGALFDFSIEIGNPFFLSQKTDDLEINYYKLVSRNAFYLPISDKWTLANSLSFGVQENLAKNGDGYIPNIKVFRLAGIDTVRGYEDEEINRLLSGKDISEETIDNKAYIFNFKIEPRYRVSDNLVAGLFYDAGRVFVDHFEPSELRSSAGLTIKYVTPVGTLDFDYGIKLLRKTLDNGKKESPGRFHLSIGFF